MSNRLQFAWLCAAVCLFVGCGESTDASNSENAVVDPPTQCAPDRPDCSVSQDFPEAADLTADNSAGIRFSPETGALVIDRVAVLPDDDGDGVPDDADDCPGTPDWISCDGDPTNDGIYQTLFYDASGGTESQRVTIRTQVADIPEVDVYFLVDATMTMADEIGRLQDEIAIIIADVRASFPNARLGLGLYREYPLSDYAAPTSQAPYHHILDLTDDDLLFEKAVSTLNTVENTSPETAATQALYSVASGLGVGDFVPNRGVCPNAPDADIGFPCFRENALHIVVNITDSAVRNGPDPMGEQYGDPPFAPGVGDGVSTRPPVEMFPALFDADDAMTALDLGDLSAKSLTLMGMSTLLTDQVNTAVAPGCESMSDDDDDGPSGDNMDWKDVVLKLRFDSTIANVDASSNNTHWPGAYVALFDDALLDPVASLACDDGRNNVEFWGAVDWAPAVSQEYFLVLDGIVSAAEPGPDPEGAFSVSIVHDGDPSNPTWMTTDAPVAWVDVETALLASNVRVASVVTLRDAMTMPSPGAGDARLIAAATDALTRIGSEWVTELPDEMGEGLTGAIKNTIELARDESAYDFTMVAEDNAATGTDELEFIFDLVQDDCAEGEPFECTSGSANTCIECDLGAELDYAISFGNTTVSPTGVSQVFDFELVVSVDDAFEVERIPVRVMVPDSGAHVFAPLPGENFYRNVYDSTGRCITPPERPKWDDLTWSGSTPGDSSIEFQIRTAPTLAELETAVPAVVVIPTDTTSDTFNIREELIDQELPWGLPYLQITAELRPSISPPVTPTLEGWSFEFFCEPAE